MKKQYMKPSVRVYELKGRSQILCGSGGDPYDEDFAYMPSVEKAENKLV